MSMYIRNNYGSSAASTFSAIKKEAKATSEETAKDSVQEYYNKLCKKFPHMSFNINGGVMTSSENKIVLNLSNDCLKKMASDPAFAEKMENDIADIPQAHTATYNKAKSDGIELHGFAVRINSDGSMQCSCSGSTRTSAGGQEKRITTTSKQKKDKLGKKHKKRKEPEEKISYSDILTASMSGLDLKA